MKNYSSSAITNKQTNTSFACGVIGLMICAAPNFAYAKKKDIAEPKEARSYAIDSAEVAEYPLGSKMEEVVVTGQYSAQSTDKAVHRIRIIDSKKIEAMGAQNLRDAMMNEMNVRLAQDGVLGSSLSIQGVSGQNVKILIDGVPVIGRQDGNIDVSQILMSNVERIEVVEGPMSVNYGTDALAGTINIITKKTLNNKFEGSVNTYTETSGNYNLSGRLGYHEGTQTVIVTGTRNLFDGWNEGDKNTIFDFAPRVADGSRSFQWKPKVQYSAGLQYIYKIGKTSINYKGDYFNETIVNRGTPDYYGQTASDDYYRTFRIDNALFVNSTIGKDHSLNAQIAYNAFKRVKNTYNKDLTTLDESLSDASGSQDTSIFNSLSSRATLSSTKRNAKLNYEVGYDVNIETGTGVRIEEQKQTIGDYAVFTSIEYKPIADLTIRPGLRYSYNTGYKAPLIPSVNIRYKYNDFTVRGSYARGFRAPTLKELFFDFHDSNHDIDGNPDLRAENSNNYSAAVAYTRAGEYVAFKAEVNGFYNDIRNRIDLALVSGTMYTYVNVSRFQTKGIQMNAEVKYNGLKVTAGAGYIGRYNSLSETADNLPSFSYTPEVRGNVMYDFKKAGLTAAVFVKRTGSAPSLTINEKDEVVNASNQGFTIADASVSKQFFDRLVQITLGSKNLFDIKTLNSSTGSGDNGAHSSSAGTSVRIPYSMGRTFFVKLDFNIHSKN